MAIKRVYFLLNNKVSFHDFDIEWNGGFSVKQKQRNVQRLHNIIAEYFNISENHILEVSTKSEHEIGRVLSSFNLKTNFEGREYYVECVYQSSKVFKDVFGEYQIIEVLNMNPKNAKIVLSQQNHFNLIKFKCFDKEFPLEPKCLFFDWLYINSIKDFHNLFSKLSNFYYFTDIEFNPQKSINSQARALVLFIWLVKNNKLEKYIENPIEFYKNIK